MKKFYVVLFVSTVIAMSSCKKDIVAKPAGDKLKTLMPAPPDSTGIGGSGGEDRPKPTG